MHAFYRININSVFTEPDTLIIEFIGRMKTMQLPHQTSRLTQLSRDEDNVVLAQGTATNETRREPGNSACTHGERGAM